MKLILLFLYKHLCKITSYESCNNKSTKSDDDSEMKNEFSPSIVLSQKPILEDSEIFIPEKKNKFSPLIVLSQKSVIRKRERNDNKMREILKMFRNSVKAYFNEKYNSLLNTKKKLLI